MIKALTGLLAFISIGGLALVASGLLSAGPRGVATFALLGLPWNFIVTLRLSLAVFPIG